MISHGLRIMLPAHPSTTSVSGPRSTSKASVAGVATASSKAIWKPCLRAQLLPWDSHRLLVKHEVCNSPSKLAHHLRTLPELHLLLYCRHLEHAIQPCHRQLHPGTKETFIAMIKSIYSLTALLNVGCLVSKPAPQHPEISGAVSKAAAAAAAAVWAAWAAE